MASARQPWLDPALGMRKKEETEELLVFGYSCKLFRDDEKAQYIDQGKHLIPWMGDDSLKIDRYDVRGTVYDLRSLEPLGGGASDALWSSLSDAERKVEQLCDEERYRALYHNEAEEALYQEEELKRLHKALDPQNSYGQVAYSYDNEASQITTDESTNKETNEAADEEDEPFIPPQELDIPVGMVLPERTKLNAIIEKTAAFINSQGPQMEIILKMKQANNPQFSFLSFDCPLHAYYRHVLMAIKTGRYRTKQQRQQQELNDSENADHYLHPSLASATTRVELETCLKLWMNRNGTESMKKASLRASCIGDMLDLIELVDKCLGAPSIPSISYKPSADCAYSMLVNKIKQSSKFSDENTGPASPADGTRSDEATTDVDSSRIILPPGDVQVIIDKMASYVIKNGRDFESVVRSKGDERFAFLEVGHTFHPYYEHKVRVYQGLEPPRDFSQASSSMNKSDNQKVVKKKQSPVKNQRPILLPGYEYSDDSSESDEEEPKSTKGELSGKSKLAPVCFSIKKPKEAEILKEVKSALPIEEESSEEDVEGESGVSSKPSNTTSELKLPEEESTNSDLPVPANPEEEMQRLQQMLKEKEKQLREQERLKKLSDKRSQDIFQIEGNDNPSSLIVASPSAPSPLVEKSTIDLNLQADNSMKVSGNMDCKELNVCDKNNSILGGKHIEELPVKNCNETSLTEVSNESKARRDSSEAKLTKKPINTDDLINDITETEIIDLTEEADESPKVTDRMRLERKRKAAAFLNLIRKEHPIKRNGKSHPLSDSDAASRHSTPSPTLFKKEKETGVKNFHEAGIPRTSLMARLAASTHLARQPNTEKKKSSKEKLSSHRKSESPVKSDKDRDTKSYNRHKNKRKKEASPSEFVRERSRSRSRSMSYSRSPPYKRRQGDDSDSEQRNHRQYREMKNDHRKKYDVSDGPETNRHRHRLRHEEERRSHSFSHTHGHERGQVRGHSRGHSHSHSQSHSHIHVHSHVQSKKVDLQASDSDSSD